MPDETELKRLAVLAALRVSPWATPAWHESAVSIIAETFRSWAERAAKLEEALRYIRRRTYCLWCGSHSNISCRRDCELAALLAVGSPQVPEAKPKNEWEQIAEQVYGPEVQSDNDPNDLGDMTPDVEADPLIELRRSTWTELLARVEALERQTHAGDLTGSNLGERT